MLASKQTPIVRYQTQNGFSHSAVSPTGLQQFSYQKNSSQVLQATGKPSLTIYQQPISRQSFSKPLQNPIYSKLNSTNLTKPATVQQVDQRQMQHLMRQKKTLQKAIESQKKRNDLIREAIRNNEAEYTKKLDETRREIQQLKAKYGQYEDQVRLLEEEALKMGFD